MTNYMLTVAYDGTNYKGFQKQPGVPTVQGALEEALDRVAVRESPLYSAGRTDSGVHAKAQVVSFHGTLRVEPDRLPRSLNSLLPPDIVVTACREVEESFHARRSAVAREYAYYFQLGEHPSPFLRRYALHVRGGLDEAGMGEALSFVKGVHDFASFCRREEGKSTVREVYAVEMSRRGELLSVRIRANAFAWMMMRMICGALLEVGRRRWSPEHFRAVLEAGDNRHGAPTLPPYGLFLEKVHYPLDPNGR